MGQAKKPLLNEGKDHCRYDKTLQVALQPYIGSVKKQIHGGDPGNLANVDCEFFGIWRGGGLAMCPS